MTRISRLVIIILVTTTARYSATGFCTRLLPCTTELMQCNDICFPSKHHPHRSVRRQQNMNDEDEVEKSEETKNKGGDTKREGLTWEELLLDAELRKIEFDSSMERKNSLLLPQRISQAITTLAWLFVVSGIILNQLGLAYVKDPSGGIGIGSLDERDFQREVLREGRMMNNAKKESSPVSIVPTEFSSHHILTWARRDYVDSTTT